ncbi:transcriptional regulator NrdR [Oceanicaulis alexandrii]|jgi:transcriptional repressor NrdR|uniref:transcriptional regulator NrdR n=1 Tax=Oceanicaulis TaxID=153232 RepID=UPI0003B6C2ED|nr:MULTISPECIES: transcriptional regulator NrdR [Oceanicaulis]MBL4537042.1 transcriptional repressor NrdR [Oceanicaulis sp.]VXC52944.1 transcriptional repressor of nrd genes [Oceanicaulis sp. 350]HCR65332.1 transcriptional repressor NrdR [Oceanicaulis sp.]|tara:strand:- start:430 stop:909 length:480 start_codon:yes stop_codon:yes gene_type:complete
MRCPFCANPDSQVKDSRPAEDSQAIRRRRHCPACGGRFTTFERVQLRDLHVLKSDNKREAFDRDKMARSVLLATQKRAIERERVEQMISGIVRRLESLGDPDVPASVIGELVMDGLRNLDTVAYVRYASVYKDFQEVDDFSEFIKGEKLGHEDDLDADQ